MTADLVAFLRARLAEDITTARRIGNMLTTQGQGQGVDLRADVAEHEARFRLHAAEMQQRLFEDTVRPYLGTAGPTGMIAGQQLRLMGARYAGHPDYRPEWRPR